MARQQLSPEGRKGVEAYTRAELHRFLVEDAVRHRATHLPWAVAAYRRIGGGTGEGAEAAYQAVLDEVESLTGHRRMPVDAPTSRAEVQRLVTPT